MTLPRVIESFRFWDFGKHWCHSDKMDTTNQMESIPENPESGSLKTLLNVGGASKAVPIPAHYQGWKHVLLDIDPSGMPDIVLDARQMHVLPAGTYDAVYCSHNLEHYHRHHGAEVIRGMCHVLKPDGFLQIRVPDLEAVMRIIAERQLDLDDFLYQSPSGPILVRDVFWGYHVEIERSGQDYYSHKTGFTPKSLVNFVSPLGFVAHAMRSNNLEIDAVFFKQIPNQEQRELLGLRG